MATRWEKSLERWTSAGVVDAVTAERIRAFEAQQEKAGGLRWPVLLALILGGLLVGAGVLLFVAAHWDELSPAARFTLVLLMVAGFHAGGALAAGRFAALSTTLHAVGTVALGAGIFLAGQIFHLQEHWPGGVMLWAVGAWLAWWLLRDWVQAALAAVLTPAWLVGEWLVATERFSGNQQVVAQSLLLLSLVYIASRAPEAESATRRALVWLGGIALIPCGILAAEPWWGSYGPVPPAHYLAIGWGVGLGLPLALAYVLRGRTARIMVAAALWVVVLGTTTTISPNDAATNLFAFFWRDFGRYLWLWLGCVGLVWWGIREARRERVNLGVTAFAITTLAFYFSSVMDKLGRSTSLIGLGVLFLVGGWMLERTRRRLMARLEETR